MHAVTDRDILYLSERTLYTAINNHTNDLSDLFQAEIVILLFHLMLHVANAILFYHSTQREHKINTQSQTNYELD